MEYSCQRLMCIIDRYYMAAKVKKTRWTLPGALLATGVGIAVSMVMAWYL